jgi:hypothetical protein
MINNRPEGPRGSSHVRKGVEGKASSIQRPEGPTGNPHGRTVGNGPCLESSFVSPLRGSTEVWPFELHALTDVATPFRAFGAFCGE